MSRIEHSRKIGRLANCFRNFPKKDFNNTAIRNIQKKQQIQQEEQIQQGLETVEKTFWQIFDAILAKTCLTETACRNLKKSAKIAKKKQEISLQQKHTDEYRRNIKNNKVSNSSHL